MEKAGDPEAAGADEHPLDPPALTPVVFVNDGQHIRRSLYKEVFATCYSRHS
jgi:hypothetical protein